jgi:hypothetical protein
MNRLSICCLFFLTTGFVSVSHADTLFEENWDSGAIDPLVWTLSQAAVDNNAYVVMDAVNGDPEGTGDKALMYRGFGSWAETIASAATYNRDTGGDGLVIEFSTWVEGGQGAPAQGINGPFHNPNAATIGPGTIEFGTDWNWPFHGWSENSMFNGGMNVDLLHSGAFAIDATVWQSRYGHSHGKELDALRVRYTLGATQGGKIEWLNTTINQETGEVVGWVSEGDFRDGDLGVGPQGTSTSATVRLGWLSLGHSTWDGNCNPATCTATPDDGTGVLRVGVFIDDLIVYAGAPTAPPAGACNLTGSCQTLTEAECTAQGGTYGGDDTICVAVFNIPGDCNQDGTLDLSDVVCLLGHLFQGNPEELPCATTAANLALMDCNQDGGTDLSDAIYKLAFLFQGGPPPDQGDDCTEVAGCPQNQGCQ